MAGTINTSPFFARCYQEGLGLAQWPYFAVTAWFNDVAVPPPGLVHLTMDPTDLWTLPALALAWTIWRSARQKNRPESSPHSTN